MTKTDFRVTRLIFTLQRSKITGERETFARRKHGQKVMKVLVISSSPRVGGNSDVLCDEFIKGAKAVGVEAEKITLADMNISPCTGCHNCVRSGVCDIDDDMARIQEKIISAEVLVLATPIYFYCMSSQMKMMIDRCLPRYRDMKSKRVWLIVTAADANRNSAQATLDGLRGFIECLPGAEECGVVYGMGLYTKTDVEKHTALQIAYEAGKSVALRQSKQEYFLSSET